MGANFFLCFTPDFFPAMIMYIFWNQKTAENMGGGGGLEVILGRAPTAVDERVHADPMGQVWGPLLPFGVGYQFGVWGFGCMEVLWSVNLGLQFPPNQATPHPKLVFSPQRLELVKADGVTPVSPVQQVICIIRTESISFGGLEGPFWAEVGRPDAGHKRPKKLERTFFGPSFWSHGLHDHQKWGSIPQLGVGAPCRAPAHSAGRF